VSAGFSLRGTETMNDCLFCKIIAGQIQGRFVYEDHELVAIRDINPQAPLHALIIPRRHIATLNDLGPPDDALVGSMARAAATIAKEHGYGDQGYRKVFNCNREAGQTVFHIHMHLLAGRGLAWPPG
jgi:histidine triad (HIT) family protein